MTAPLSFPSLPPHMIDAAIAHGLSPVAVCYSVLGTDWYIDGVMAVDSGLRSAIDIPIDHELAGAVCARQAEEAPVIDGDVVRIGAATIEPRRYAYVMAIHPGATWETGRYVDDDRVKIYAVALAKRRPVSMVWSVEAR